MVLSFCIKAWGGARSGHSQPLYLLQKNLLQVAFKRSKRCPIDFLFQNLAVLIIRQLYIKQLCVYMYKHLGTISHQYRIPTTLVTPQM